MTVDLPPPPVPQPGDLLRLFGKMDVYLFDQFLKGRIRPGMKVLDAGCGDGRNLVYLMRAGFDVYGVDNAHESLQAVRRLARKVAPNLPETNFRADMVESLSFPDATFDVVLSNAVLHYCRDEEHSTAMVTEMARVLRPGGMLFARLMSTIGIESLVESQGARRYRLPGGTEHLLADAEYLEMLTERVGAEWVEPLKSVVVAGSRSMAVWVIRKRG